MEEVAQGRVWTGKDAASHGLVDAIGGLSRAIAIAKLKANIPQDQQVGFRSHLFYQYECCILEVQL
jgi:protease-4